MTAALRQPRHPAPEREDPREALLDAAEAMVGRALDDDDLAAPMRARLERLLLVGPSGARTAPGPATNAASPDGSRIHGAGAVSAPEAPSESSAPSKNLSPLDLAAVLTACRQLEAYRMPAGQRAAIANLKRWVLARLLEANQGDRA